MSKYVCCEWCLSSIQVKDSFNPKKKRVVCSTGCKDAELLFQQHWNDEEINRRDHYAYLTKGEDDVKNT